jgi:hypothetical protein
MSIAMIAAKSWTDKDGLLGQKMSAAPGAFAIPNTDLQQLQERGRFGVSCRRETVASPF